MANVCVDFGALESLLEVVIDGLVGHLAEQSQIGDTNLLLLGGVEGGLFRFGAAAARGSLLSIAGRLVLGTP